MGFKLIPTSVVMGGLISIQAQASLLSDATLNFSQGSTILVCTLDQSAGNLVNGCPYGVTATAFSGSWFSMDKDFSGTVDTTLGEVTVLSNNQGIILGTSQPASGSHTGAPNASESPSIDTPWLFFSSTGMHQSTSPITVLSDDGAGNAALDFSGWNITWNNIASIPMGAGADNGIANITCYAGAIPVPTQLSEWDAPTTMSWPASSDCVDGSAFLLSYAATVPAGDPSGFGGVPYELHLEGVISQALQAMWTGLSGLWEDVTNWSDGVIPSDGEEIRLTQNDNIDRVVTYTNQHNPNATLDSLTIDSTGAGKMVLLQSQDSLHSTSQTIGDVGEGIHTQAGGTNTIDNGLTLGKGSSSVGTYNLNGGTLNAGTIVVGDLGTGNFNQTGGLTNVNSLQIGSLGNYVLSGNSELSSNSVDVAGMFSHNSGTHNVTNELLVNSSGRYGLSGTGSLSAANQTIRGLFNQSGGINIVTNTLEISGAVPAIYNMSSGSLSSDNIIIGNNSESGELNQTGGMVSVNTSVSLGETAGSVGAYTISNEGMLTSNSIVVGEAGSGNLDITNGGVVTNTSAYIARQAGSVGEVNINGQNSAWTITDGLFVGGQDLYSGGSGTLTIGTGGTVDITNALTIWQSGAVNLNGGSLQVGSLNLSGGALSFNSGHLGVNNDFLVGVGSFFGTSSSISSNQILTVGGTTTVDSLSTFALDGGEFTTGSFVNNGVFQFNSGKFGLTSDNLIVGNGGIFGNTLSLTSGKEISVTNNTSINLGSILQVQGGVFSSGNLTNSGEIILDGITSRINGNNLTNNGRITGTGQINSSLINIGEVRAVTGDRLVFSGVNNTNQNRINMIGGTVEFDGAVTNEVGGVISGRGTLIANTGLNNEGNIAFSGGYTDVLGDVTNSGNGAIIVTGGATATFYDDLINNGGEIRTSAGSQSVYLGSVSGSGAFTGTGTNYFEGDLRPGNSPSEVIFEGDIILGYTNTLLIEIGGLTAGEEYDVVNVAGTANLGGTLDVDLYDLGSGVFDVSLGDSFDIIFAETIYGEFDLLTLAVLGNGLGWDLSYIVDAIGSTDVVRLNVVSAVPVPPAVWLFGSGLVALFGFTKRKAK